MQRGQRKYRDIVSMLLAGCILFFTSSCGMTMSLETDKLMVPPVISTEQKKIEAVLNKELPEGYSYKYPKNGEIQDAIILRDFDDDGMHDAIVFVKEVGESAQAHVLILREDEEKNWVLIQDIEGSGADIDRVMLSQLEDDGYNVIIGYSAYSNIKKMDIYRWVDTGLEEVYPDISYLSFTAIPSPITNHEDLVVVSKEYNEGSTVEQARLSIYSNANGNEIVRKSYVPLGIDIPQVIEVYTEKLTEREETLIYLDLTITPGQDMFTTAYLYDSFHLTQVLSEDGQEIRRLTVRDQMSTQDIDGDGHYEVRTGQDASKAVEIEDTKATESLDVAYWGAVEDGVFRIKSPVIYNSSKNSAYLYVIPDEWAGQISVEMTRDGQEMLIKSKEENENYLSILSIPKRDLTTEQKGTLQKEGYRIIVPEDETSDIVYYKKVYKNTEDGTAGKILLYNGLEEEAVGL